MKKFKTFGKVASLKINKQKLTILTKNMNEKDQKKLKFKAMKKVKHLG